MAATQTYDAMRSRAERLADARLKERILRGLDVLRDEYGDDWVEHIDLDKLQMSRSNVCILGQLEPVLGGGGQYEAAIVRIDGDLEDAPWDFGFDVADGELGDYARLTDAWRAVIGGEEA